MNKVQGKIDNLSTDLANTQNTVSTTRDYLGIDIDEQIVAE